MPETPFTLLQELTTRASDDRQTFVFQNPVLLSPSVQKALSERLSSLASAEHERLDAALEDLRQMRSALESQSQQYPIGIGPVEQLWQRQSRGEITAEYAQQLAATSEITLLLSPLYVNALSYFVRSTAQLGGWQPAVPLQQLLLSAVSALPDTEEAEAMRKVVSLDWVEIVHATLMEYPDGRLYRDACAIGDQMVERATATNDRRFLGEMLHHLGTMHLDPYTAGRSSTNYRLQLQFWQNRLFDQLGDEIAGLPEDEWRMPSPEDALRRAESYLRQAVPFRTGHEQGLSLKALVQALTWLKDTLEQPVDRDELIHLCHQALGSLKDDRDPQHRLQVLVILQAQDQPVDVAEVETIFQISLDEHVRRLGMGPTADLVQLAASVLKKDNPVRSVEVMRNAHSLVAGYDHEPTLMSFWSNELMFIRQSWAPEPPPTEPPPEGGLRNVAQQLRDRAKQEQWDVRKLSAGLISLAERAPNWDEEAAGLEVLDEAVQTAPLFADEYANALSYLRVLLWVGLGVNSVNEEAWGSAISAYTRGLRQCLDLKLTDYTLDLLRRVDDLASKQDSEVAMQIVLGLAPLALPLERSIGEPVTRIIQHLCKRTIAAMTEHTFNVEALFFLLQVAKGLRLATALYAGSRYRWQEDERGMYLLEQVREAESALPTKSRSTISTDQEALLDEDMLLTAYARSDRLSGDTPEERLRNLQHSYDAHFVNRLLASAEGDEALYLSAADLQSALDERTALVIFYLGASPDGQIAIYTMVLTQEDIQAGFNIEQFPDDALLSVGEGEQEIQMSPFAFNVWSLRQDLNLWPGPRLVAREAEQTLASNLTSYLGNMAAYLQDLHADGKDHLCIIPHGPLHYYPMHLLGEPGRPLADQWTVTYLPNLHLFVSRRGRPAVPRHRDRALTAIGLELENNPWGLPPLAEATAEAREIAAMFNTEPILEEQATKESILKALDESRFVHLAAHGQHNVDAPAFQCLYMAPDEESDGRLHAHELASLDLRGLEILTLSACETALGRFDTADNVRGLPASFLLAGVSTIVGTLWDVETNASKQFFSTFYRELSAGTNRLDAFAIAQQETRAAFPKYRDWGPFYLIGEWL